MDATILQNRSPEVSWEGLGAILASSWRFWAYLGAKLGGLGLILAPRWRSWADFGPKLESKMFQKSILRGSDRVFFGVHLGQRC